MVPIIITLLQWEFVVTTMIIFFSVPFSNVEGTSIKVEHASGLFGPSVPLKG